MLSNLWRARTEARRARVRLKHDAEQQWRAQVRRGDVDLFMHLVHDRLEELVPGSVLERTLLLVVPLEFLQRLPRQSNVLSSMSPSVL